MKTEFKIKPKIWRLLFYGIASFIISFLLQDEIDLSTVNMSIILAVFFWFMFVMQLIGYIFPRTIWLRDKYLEYKFLANKTIIPYSEIKVFLRKNFLMKLYLITDQNRQRKIAFTELSDEFIKEFEEALEIKLIENKIT